MIVIEYNATSKGHFLNLYDSYIDTLKKYSYDRILFHLPKMYFMYEILKQFVKHILNI